MKKICIVLLIIGLFNTIGFCFMGDNQNFYGKWKVNKVIFFGPASASTDEEVKKLLGKEVFYEKEICGFKKNICKKVYYQVESISENDFTIRNNAYLRDIGINASKITMVSVYTNLNHIDFWDSFGNMFYIKNNKTIIVQNNGAYFELLKIK